MPIVERMAPAATLRIYPDRECTFEEGSLIDLEQHKSGKLGLQIHA